MRTPMDVYRWWSGDSVIRPIVPPPVQVKK